MAVPAGSRDATFPPDWVRYSDPGTELNVYRLTGPGYNSALPASYNRSLSRNGAFLLFSCDRTGSREPFQMDLKTGATRRLTQAQDLDCRSLVLLPGDRSFCYLAGHSVFLANLSASAGRAIYTLPAGWEACSGLSAAQDGSHVFFVERQGGRARLRMAPVGPGEARTLVEADAISDPIERPRHAQVLYREGDSGLWLKDLNSPRNRRLKLAPGRIGPAYWTADGASVLYLNFPEDRTQLNAIRQNAPDSDTDQRVAKTSQYADFGCNRDASVLVGASRNAASPDILIMLRVNGREMAVCGHGSSRPETAAPMFSPDAQRIYFQSDRGGKTAIYCVQVEGLVEKIE